MNNLIPYLTKEEISDIIEKIASRISNDYQNETPVVLGVLNGAFMFTADLVRRLNIPVKVDFVGVSSYGSDTCTSGKVELCKALSLSIENEHVIVVEDIVDTGLSLTYLIDYLKTFKPKSVKICSLLEKRERQEKKIKIDYLGHVVTQGFLVGYGLDFDGKYRELPAIFHMNA